MANVLLIAVVPLMVVTRRSSVKEKIHIYICIYILYAFFFLFFRIFNNTMKGKLKLLVFIFIYCCFYNQLSGKNRIE